MTQQSQKVSNEQADLAQPYSTLKREMTSVTSLFKTGGVRRDQCDLQFQLNLCCMSQWKVINKLICTRNKGTMSW